MRSLIWMSIAYFINLLSKGELAELNGNPLITIANHSANHFSFTSLDNQSIIDESRLCRDYIHSAGSEYGQVFAYPFGDYNHDIQDLLSSAGYKFQFVVDAIPNSSGTTFERLVINPFISVHNQLRAIEDGKYI